MTSDAEAGPRLGFLTELRERAAARPRAIVYPEADDPRVLDAVTECVRFGLVQPVLLGDPETVGAELDQRGVDPSAVRIVAGDDPELHARTRRHIADRRERRHDSAEALDAMAADPLFQAATLVAMSRRTADAGLGRPDEDAGSEHEEEGDFGPVHGMVGGCVRTTADVVRAGLVCLGVEPGMRTLSSAFYMVFGAEHVAGPRVLTFTDAGVVPTPASDQLAEIAAAAVVARRHVVGDEPRVAFLSYSSKGSAEGPAVEPIREALSDFRSRMPDVPADGELQADAALDAVIGARKAPDSEVAGRANILVFPDLASANIAYKLVQHLAGAVALGPILQGLPGALNDLSRGADVADIVAVSCITSLQSE